MFIVNCVFNIIVKIFKNKFKIIKKSKFILDY